MSQPYVGEIRMFAGNFAPAGWMFCQGQLLNIADNQVLFQLIGTTYGGDGQNTFALPNLQSRVPVHMGTDNFGNPYVIGQAGGEETVTLTTNQIPAHSHVPAGFSNAGGGNQNSPQNGLWASSTSGSLYANTAGNIAMNAAAIGPTGGSQPHDNMVPFLVINFIISLFGVFPSQV